MIKKSNTILCVAISVTSISSIQAKDKYVLLKMPIYYNSNLPGIGVNAGSSQQDMNCAQARIDSFLTQKL